MQFVHEILRFNSRPWIYSDWQTLQGNEKRANRTHEITKGALGMRERKIPSFIDLLPDTTFEFSGQPQSHPSPSSFTIRNTCQASFILSYQTNAFKQCVSIFHGLLETAVDNVFSPLEVFLQIHHTVWRILNHLSESSQRVLNQVTQWILQREQTKRWKSPQHVVTMRMWNKYTCAFSMLPRGN